MISGGGALSVWPLTNTDADTDANHYAIDIIIIIIINNAIIIVVIIIIIIIIIISSSSLRRGKMGGRRAPSPVSRDAPRPRASSPAQPSYNMM